MSIQQAERQHPVLYQAEPNALSTLRSIRDRIHQICNTYVNRYVRVQTLDGSTYEGIIVQCDSGHLYLLVSGHHDQRQLFGPGPYFGPGPLYGPGSFYNPYPLYGLGSIYASQQTILTLVLFELLVIVLLS